MDVICDGKNPNDMSFDAQAVRREKREYTGQIVICTYDKRCYPVVDLDFDNSPSSLPIEGLGISHADYFRDRKKIPLKYPDARPIVAVLGRNNSRIYLPAELVCVNELNPFVKQQLPMVASFKPKQRHDAIEEIRKYLVPAGRSSNNSANGHGLLPALGLVLRDERIKVNIEVLPLPLIKAAGMEIPKEKGKMWAPVIGRANYRADPGSIVYLKVVLVHHHSIASCCHKVYEKLRDTLKRLNSTYRFDDQPYEIMAVGDNEKHYQPVEKFFVDKQPDNIFVLDLSRPPRKQALDEAYYVVKHILTRGGYLSQFINFNTCDHSSSRDARKSNTIMSGVARQVLSKCGVRVWWVNIPKQVPVPAVFVGVDVFHAPRKYDHQTGTRSARESVAGVTVQIIRSHEERENDNVEIYSQTFRRKAGQELELGTPINQAVSNALRIFDVNPMSCVVWRDGVGNPAVNQVANQEIPAVRLALAKANANALGDSNEDPEECPLSYIVVQKSIATKFLSVDGSRAMPTGALVLSLQGPEHATFYINGTSPPYSTPKPARFIIAQMDHGFGSRKKMLAELSWAMCHDYSNWTGPIKLPAPVQMAHKVAELAGGMPDCGDSIDAEAFAGKIYFL
jgi:aubergine-like protein